MINLKQEFEKAVPIEVYKTYLGEQRALHDLHYKRAEISADALPENLPPLRILIITEPWCGDSTAIVPVLQKLFEGRDVVMRVAFRDENPELMDQFLTNGGRSIPVILILDEQGRLRMRFGPRPQKAQAVFEQYKPLFEEGKMERKEISKKIRAFYSKDRGRAIVEEFTTKLASVL
ncbi:MAG: thioredoxin family protein [Calditrichaeota bacterium]|nr:MAG: thioredoxin family protein [Calditrichota bacterium]